VLQIASLSRPESGRRGPLLEPLRAAVAKLRSQPQSIVRQEHRFEVDDVLTVRASAADIHRAEVDWRLGVLPLEGGEGQLSQLLSSELGVAEVLLTPRSRYIGEVIGDDWLVGEARVAVLGVRRGTTQLSPNAELQFGDSILINGMWETIGDLQDAQDDLIVVGCPEEIASQVTGLSTQSGVALAILIGMVGLMVSGEVPVAIAALVAAGAMVLFGCLTTQEAYGAVSWSTVILIAGMLPMATALENTGGAKHMADILVETLGGIGHVAVLAGICVVTTTLSQVMSNTATAVLMSPIVITAAESLGVSPHPLMMGLAVAASTAFLTPIGTTTNLLVLSPGNYRFSDYGKVGAPLVAIFLLISLVLIPIFWPF
jgi:di/tricarboxylate transporter